MTTTIYALLDPRSDAYRYVGKTRNVQRRYYNHCLNARDTCSLNKYGWIEALRARGLTPKLVVLEECEDADAGQRELWWIDELIGMGANLCNRPVLQYPFASESQQVQDNLTLTTYHNLTAMQQGTLPPTTKFYNLSQGLVIYGDNLQPWDVNKFWSAVIEFAEHQGIHITAGTFETLDLAPPLGKPGRKPKKGT